MYLKVTASLYNVYTLGFKKFYLSRTNLSFHETILEDYYQYSCVAKSKIVAKGSLCAIEYPGTYLQRQITIYRHVLQCVWLFIKYM